ncbi:MAG: hypothetical protein ACRD3N_16080 [Terracidiphilus sp.]
MRAPAKYVSWLLPLLLAPMLTGCFHKQPAQTQPLAPPIAEPAPAPTPPSATANLPPPVITIPTEPAPSKTAGNNPTPPPLKPQVRHRKPASSDTNEETANGASGVSAVGQLSSGDPPDLRRQTEDSIAATERGLSGINRQLNDQDQHTVEHIREFLKQAKHALVMGDIDGASTLAAKARVLLAEVVR